MSSDSSPADTPADTPADSGAQPPLVASVVPLVPAWRVDRTFDYSIPEDLEVAFGSVVGVKFGNRKIRGVVVGISPDDRARELEPIDRVVVSQSVVSPATVGVLTWLSERYVTPKGRTFARVVPPRVRVKPRPSLGLSGDLAAKTIMSYGGGPELIRALEEGKPGTWAVRTLLGEDRGAMIAELVAASARGGRGASLVAVPEVRYGSHILDRLAREFPEFRRIDSSTSDGDRSRALLEMASGHPLAGGGRSAVLAPCDPLGLIVLDEEHHPTYKEDRSPRYDARRVAVERARAQGATCVLLSACPSIETGAAARTGAFGWVEPDRATTRAARPAIEFVDRSRDRLVSHQLHERMRDVLNDGGKVAILAPTRGYARALWCGDCRRSLRCRVCEAGLIYGQSKRDVRCPRCGWAGPAPEQCPSCASTDFRYLGAGSERLAEQLARAFPRSSVTRIDPDVLEGDDLPEHGDIYVTTWIGTKAALRPDVSLVAVLDADALIRRPDFRSAENAYQALVEMCEWAGPATHGGRLLIQADEVAHHCLQAIARSDYAFFLERELRLREELGYPPFSELVKIRVEGPGRGDVAARVAEISLAAGATVLGPIEVGFGPDRFLELLLKCPDADTVAPALRDIVAGEGGDATVRIDVDPR